MSHADKLSSLRAGSNVKSVASVETYIEKGSLMGVVPDYLELGKASAAIVHRHQQGTNLREIPVQTAKQPQLLINKTTSKALGVNLPEALLKKAVFVQ